MGRAATLFIVLGLSSLPSPVRADGPFKPSAAFVPAPWSEALDREVANIQRRFKGQLAAYVSDPYRGYRWGHRDTEPFYLASGVKVAFMIEVYRQREQGRLRFDEELVYGPEQIRDGAPRVNAHPAGTKFTIGRLLEFMMQHSDNAASDMLVGRVGIDRVNQGLKEEGIDGVTPLTYLLDVRRGIYGELDPDAAKLTPLEIRTVRWTPIWDPQVAKLTQLLGKPKGTYKKSHLLDAYTRYYAKNSNRAPMASMGLIFEKMVRGELVNAQASREMRELMSNAKTSTRRLMGRLPPGTRVAHKTGSQFERTCDLGIITLPDGQPLIVTVCTEGPVVTAEPAIARLARAAYDLAAADHRKASKETAQRAP